MVHDDVTAGNEREVETVAECVMGGESEGGTMVSPSSSSSSGTDHHVTHVATGEREEGDGEPKRRQAM